MKEKTKVEDQTSCCEERTKLVAVTNTLLMPCEGGCKQVASRYRALSGDHPWNCVSCGKHFTGDEWRALNLHCLGVDFKLLEEATRLNNDSSLRIRLKLRGYEIDLEGSTQNS